MQAAHSNSGTCERPAPCADPECRGAGEAWLGRYAWRSSLFVDELPVITRPVAAGPGRLMDDPRRLFQAAAPHRRPSCRYSVSGDKGQGTLAQRTSLDVGDGFRSAVHRCDIVSVGRNGFGAATRHGNAATPTDYARWRPTRSCCHLQSASSGPGPLTGQLTRVLVRAGGSFPSLAGSSQRSLARAPRHVRY